MSMPLSCEISSHSNFIYEYIVIIQYFQTSLNFCIKLIKNVFAINLRNGLKFKSRAIFPLSIKHKLGRLPGICQRPPHALCMKKKRLGDPGHASHV